MLRDADGTVCRRCLLLADDPAARRRGLQGVTDLGDHDGMAFVYETPTTARFWMRDTVLPLSIAFYAGTGGRLAAFDMAPCRRDPCPTFGPPVPFVVAVEVPAGRLAELGFTASAVLTLEPGPCTSSALGAAAGDVRTG